MLTMWTADSGPGVGSLFILISLQGTWFRRHRSTALVDAMNATIGHPPEQVRSPAITALCVTVEPNTGGISTNIWQSCSFVHPALVYAYRIEEGKTPVHGYMDPAS